MKIAVFGAGMIGRTIAKDLSKNFEVVSFDIDQKNLNKLDEDGIKTVRANLMDYAGYDKLLSGFDLCACAVPGFMGYRALESIIKAGKNVVDISFSREDATQLHELAVKKKVTAIIDCGVAPGMSNLILGQYNEKMEIDSFECMVGGLPKIRNKPFEYKAPFSPVDVIEEYIRPARFIENGILVERPAMSDTELIDFKEVGTLESFNTDGLRSIINTMGHIKNMKEKTLRYPGHIGLMQSLFQSGFFSEDKIMIDGAAISRKDFTCKVLFDVWKLNPDDEEFTIMKVILKGKLKEKQTTIEYLLYDEYDKGTKIGAMSRTTAYTCTATVNLLANNIFTEKGVHPPELVGKHDECFKYIIDYLKERKVIYKKTVASK